MNLKEKINEFLFNLETANLLQSAGRSKDQITQEMNLLNFSESLINFQNSSRHLFNSVMLRLKLYSENNLAESEVRQSLSVLNNSYVCHLLDYLYSNNLSLDVSQPVSQVGNKVVVSQPAPQAASQVAPQAAPQVAENKVEQQLDENDSEDDSSNEDSDPFESFFVSCVEKTDEPTDIVKASDFYTAFCEWYEGQYDNNVPDKKELKNYLNDKLGKSKKSTWTNVVLTN